MPVVTFLPSQAAIIVEPGASLLDAATAAGVTISAPCGGEGACGECRVRIAHGQVEHAARGCLSPEELGAGWALACSSRVTGDVTVEVPAPGEATSGNGAQIVSEAHHAHASHGGSSHLAAHASAPLAVRHHVKVDAPALDNSFSDLERLVQAIKSNGGPGEITCGLGVLRRLAAALRAREHNVTVTLFPLAGDAAEIIRIEPGESPGSPGESPALAFGLAIDIGTTTCAVHLIDLTRNQVLGTASDYNAQIARGLDVISRINYARLPERREELRQLVLGNLNALTNKLCREHLIDPGEIDNAAVAGNTTMIHLLLGLDPEFIRLEPYTPTINRPPLLRAGEVGLAMNPDAYIQIAPGVGSYVGGDITAGLLQTALITDSEEVRLFLDIGTNGEVVVGNGEWLMACAASAGPAFEGSGVTCGMRAAQGAIERVRIDPATCRAEYSVIGGGRPRGICGSGMIDLLAEMWSAGLLDPSGKLHAARCPERIRPASASGRNRAYVIVPAALSETGEDIALDEQDIMNLLRTKAAIYSACAIMLKSVGLDFDAVAQVYVAGGFGRFLDIQKSIIIGMLPDLPLERYTYLGNSSLGGARAMLTSPQARAKVIELADRITYLELNTDPSYMDEYMAALFLPHTDLSRFPSVLVAKRPV